MDNCAITQDPKIGAIFWTVQIVVQLKMENIVTKLIQDYI